jgi:5-methylcytosine-specific restriction protein A
MPMLPARRCSGCGALVTARRCPTCVRQAEVRRGTAAARGYGARWQRYRAWYLSQYPLCGDRAPGAPETRDSRCRAEGRFTPATLVDHIIPVSSAEDATFYRSDGHQALCDRCHQAKRQRESVGDRRITGSMTPPDRRQADFRSCKERGANGAAACVAR